jgi:hypothetical protein
MRVVKEYTAGERLMKRYTALILTILLFYAILSALATDAVAQTYNQYMTLTSSGTTKVSSAAADLGFKYYVSQIIMGNTFSASSYLLLLILPTPPAISTTRWR